MYYAEAMPPMRMLFHTESLKKCIVDKENVSEDVLPNDADDVSIYT